MKRARSVVSGVGCLLVVGLLASACNSILGNEEGTLRATNVDAAPVDGTVDSAADTGTPGPRDGSADAQITCSAVEKLCTALGACLGKADPNFGCGNADCKPCGTDNATGVACAPNADNSAIVCKLSCKPGFDDCDKDASNGCEQALNDPKHCGVCGTACGPAEFCAPDAVTGTNKCSASCTLPLTQCPDKVCTDLTKDSTHCGNCTTDCTQTAPDNASGSCKASVCQYSCNTGFHTCGDKPICFSDGDPAHCGPACSDCNALGATKHLAGGFCKDNSCQYQGCDANWGDCNGKGDGSDADGCEADLMNSALTCGDCHTACSGTVYFGGGPLPGPGQCCSGFCAASGTACPL